MARTIDIGSSALGESAAPDIVPVYVAADGTGVNIAVNAGDTLNYYTSLDQPVAGTIASGSNQQFTSGPVWVASNGISNVTFTGGGY